MKAAADYTVLFCDADMVVLNKRSGLLVAADRYDEAAPRLDELAGKEFGRLYAVHCIDKDTSGIVAYARTPGAHRELSAQFERRTVHTTYHCLVHGRPLWQTLRADQRLLPDGDARHRTTVNRTHGKLSVTCFRLIGACGPYSWVEACPETGRIHQIRAHLQANGLAIVCDPLYSGNQHPVLLSDLKRRWNGDTEEERPLLSRLALHAWRLSLAHPSGGMPLSFTAPYPRDLEAVRRQLAKLFKVDPLAGEP